MYKNLHIDSVERNGVGIFRVLNWQEPKGGCSFSLAQRKRTKRDIHPHQGLSLYGEDATAPPVALTLMYPRPIKGSGCFLSTTLDAGRLVD